MEPSPSELARSLALLERRVAALETLAAAAGGAFRDAAHLTGAVDPSSTALPQAPVFPRADFITIPALVGRTFLALAGAYLLRALTDSGTLRPEVGVAAGLAYATFWLTLADRAAVASRMSASFHGLVASLVAFPVLWEATMRFGLLTPTASATMLAIVTAAGLVVAARRRLHVVAWTVALLGASVAGALVPATDRIVPFTVVLIALGVATLWLGYLLDWVVLRWPLAAFADFAVIGITFRVATHHGVETAAHALALQVLLIAAYLVSIIVRTLVRGRDVVPFEVIQGIIALTIGLGGAVTVAGAGTAGTILVGVLTALLGAACYVAAFVFIVTRQGERANFYFYTTLALMLVLASAHLLLVSPPLTMALSMLTVGATAVAVRKGPRFVVTHAAIYAVAAALASGLLWASAPRLLAPDAVNWPGLEWPMLAALAAIVACECIRMPKRGGIWDHLSHAPRLVLLLLTMWGGAGVLIELVTRAVGGGTTAIGSGALATVRTVVISGAALGLARLGQSAAFREARWVVYPLLVIGGGKLLLEDLPRSRPATLFIAFAAYGVALIVAPRLMPEKVRKPAADENTPVPPEPQREEDHEPAHV